MRACSCCASPCSQKLGFLLYGPPGTGKTSFIKALAQYTKRSVMSIPLTKIRTNQELMWVRAFMARAVMKAALPQI